jgi:hypothetical protein
MQSTIDGKPPPVSSSDPGKQNVLGNKCTAQEGLVILQQAKANARLPAAATEEEEEEALRTEWGTYRLSALSEDVTGEGLMASLTARTTDPKTKRVTVAPIADRRSWWATYMQQEGYPMLAKAARRLLAMHVTSYSAERNWSVWGQVYTKGRNRLGLTLGEMYIRGNLREPGGKDEEVLLREIAEMEVAAGSAAAYL